MAEKSKIVINQGFSDINPLICGEEQCASGHSYGPAARSYWLLHYVVSGKGMFTSPRGTFSVSKGEIFIIRPYEITFYQADTSEPWKYIWIGFTASTLLPPAMTDNDTVYAPYLADVFFDCLSEPDIASLSAGYEYFLCAKIWEILGKLSRLKQRNIQTFERYIKPAINIMEAEICNGITVEEVAERLHINRSYFSVIFKDSMKISPQKYLLGRRMERAAELLTNHALNNTVTAASVGYSDVFVFSRAFKSYFGVSPSEYKKLTSDSLSP